MGDPAFDYGLSVSCSRQDAGFARAQFTRLCAELALRDIGRTLSAYRRFSSVYNDSSIMRSSSCSAE
jgi:hypothetical protein